MAKEKKWMKKIQSIEKNNTWELTALPKDQRPIGVRWCIKPRNNPSTLKEFKNAIAQVFGMTDIGLMSYYLGIEVTQQDDGIFIFQEGYAKEILNKFKIDDSNPVSTPVECGVKLSKKDIGDKVNALGALRPDVA
ncbi:hypothetical protein RJ640_023758 [Escallonia rubra]|uniref:Reverse transcriptase Ty1/copia-type domain-containing protein n=1 Tax=Escallonia rubra TaxID=112253 RepID=A0AA88UKE3_9ASTE|nr:hypothetical protein RJ640_023758 [Escallonia rubra]